MLILEIAAGVAFGQFLFTLLITLAEPFVARSVARKPPDSLPPIADQLAVEGLLEAAGTGALLNAAIRNKYAIN